ncbi:MAG: hypothetical protein IIT82_00585, partial [Selenomonas sp.]|nr:hypothetical protein [Selenomonas sp.]
AMYLMQSLTEDYFVKFNPENDKDKFGIVWEFDLNADFDLSGSDILDISLALGDFGYTRMSRLWAQLYASLAWDVARDILPCCAMLGQDYIDFSTIAGRSMFERGMEKRDREHGIKRRPPHSVREYTVLQKCGEA